MLLIYYVIALYNSITYMCFLKDFKENRPRLALILRLTGIVGIDMIYNSNYYCCYLIIAVIIIAVTSVSTPILAGSL